MTARVSSAAWVNRLRCPSCRNCSTVSAWSGVDPDPGGDLAHLDAGAALVVAGAKQVERFLDGFHGLLHRNGERRDRHRGLDHEEDGFQRGRQLLGFDRPGRDHQKVELGLLRGLGHRFLGVGRHRLRLGALGVDLAHP
jgi:hypothetical protein